MVDTWKDPVMPIPDKKEARQMNTAPQPIHKSIYTISYEDMKEFAD